MRGTDDLSPDQRPSMKMTRRTQPHRRKKARYPGQSLTAMLKGAPFFLPNPMDQQRRFIKRRGR